jgi:hypothetical protein
MKAEAIFYCKELENVGYICPEGQCEKCAAIEQHPASQQGEQPVTPAPGLSTETLEEQGKRFWDKEMQRPSTPAQDLKAVLIQSGIPEGFIDNIRRLYEKGNDGLHPHEYQELRDFSERFVYQVFGKIKNQQP